MPAGISILIVDDEQYLRLTLSIILKRKGYCVATAANSSDALRLLESRPFDLLFLDLHMPSVGGMDLLRLINSIQPLLPVVILTVEDSVDSTLEAFRCGAVAYILKPFDPDEIHHCIQAILKEQYKARFREQMQRRVAGLA
ncbi:MAG: response regulator [Chloroflexota bacterium]|nr:MAG: response regulator [Chloroflexota bacterium]